MNFGDMARGVWGAARDWRESVESIRATQGKGASRSIAERFGVSMRTAQKWLKGTQEPDARSGRRSAVRQGGESARIAAQTIRSAQALTIGDVDVEYDGKPQGKRKIGTLHVDADLRAALDRVAGLIEIGSFDEAEQEYSDAVLGAYSGQRAKDDRRVLHGTLKISDYGSGSGIV